MALSYISQAAFIEPDNIHACWHCLAVDAPALQHVL